MSIPLRIELTGGLYHFISRCDRREASYFWDADRRAWLKILQAACERFNWRCHGWCQMTNYFHLDLEAVEGNLSQDMLQLNGVYTQYVNRTHQHVGHVFQWRYKAVLVERERHLLELEHYVVLNPVRAGTVADAADWTWSSYADFVSDAVPPPWLVVEEALALYHQVAETRPELGHVHACNVALARKLAQRTLARVGLMDQTVRSAVFATYSGSAQVVPYVLDYLPHLRAVANHVVGGGAFVSADTARVLPFGEQPRIKKVLWGFDEVTAACVGDSITVALADERDASSGDVLVAADSSPEVADQFAVMLLWITESTLVPGRQYLMKHACKKATVTITALKYRKDVNNGAHLAAKNMSSTKCPW